MPVMTKRTKSALVLAAAVACTAPAAMALPGEDLSNLDKGHRLLIQNGLQVIGLVDTGTPFTPATYQAANYTSILWWMGNMNPGVAPNTPWVESVPSPSLMPDLNAASLPPGYMNKLVGLSLGDENNLNDRSPGGVFDQNVAWFQAAKANPAYANTILYANSWGSQLTDQNLNDFIAQARPDMVSFDTYPWIAGQGGAVTDWYTWLRRYRVYANAYNIPFAVYRQTYHSDSEGRRDPSPSEQNLNTFGALAFGATYLADFTYNSGATSLFDRFPSDPNHGAGDLLPNALYYRQATINQQARNLGPALVRLKQIADYSAGYTIPNKGIYSPNQAGHTTSMMIIRGKHMEGANQIYNPLPSGFEQDREAGKDANGNSAYSDWVYTGNDPYLSGWSVTNPGTMNGGLPGDVILSWFTPLDESFDGAAATDERYLMIVNGFTGPDGTAADYRQHLTFNFNFSSAPAGFNKTMLERLDENTGQVVDVPLSFVSGSTYRLTLDLDGGMGALFKFADGAPFVLPEPTSLGLLALGAMAILPRRRR
jgi:hypothetical protein